MAVVITPKRGDSDPGTDDLADGEIAIRKDVNPPKLFVRVGSNIREIGGGSGGDANQTLTTGNGLTGANSGSDGDFTIAVGAGTGIDVAADAISVDVSDFMANGSNNRIVTATGSDAMNAEANFTFDGTDALIASTGKLQFRDGNSYIFSNAANDLELVGTDITLDAGTLIDLQQKDIRIGDGTNDTTLTFNAGNDGEIKWSEDEDYFQFADEILMSTSEEIHFRDTNIYLNSPASDQLQAVSDGTILLDAAGDITFSADGDQINMDDGSTTRFVFNVDSTPELDVTGNFTIDGSGTVTVDATGGITLKEDGGADTVIRPTAVNGKNQIQMSSNIQYYHASTDASTFAANSSNTGDANSNVRFLPFNTHATADSADEPEHYFQAPCNGHVIAVTASSNNNLVKPFDPGQGFLAWQCHLQILERDGSGGANIFGGSVDAGDSRVTGTNTSATEIDGINHTNGEYQECLFPVGGTDIFNLVKGNHYSFVMRFSKMNFDEGLGTNATTSKNQTLHLTYIISWDETTSGSTLGDWSGY